MDFAVPLQVRPAGLVACVHAPVALQIPALVEALPALVTAVGLLARVHAPVRPQVSPLFEDLPTNITNEGLGGPLLLTGACGGPQRGGVASHVSMQRLEVLLVPLEAAEALFFCTAAHIMILTLRVIQRAAAVSEI